MKPERLLVFVLITSFLIGSAAARQMGEEEKKALQTLQASLRLSAAGDGIWPGFDLSQYGFALAAPKAGAYLVGFDPAPAGTDLVEGTGFNQPVYFTRDASGMTANTAITFANKSTAVIQLANLTTGSTGAIELIFHEAFHAFQGDAGRAGASWRREDSRLAAQYPADPKNLALFGIEGRILLAALQSANDKILREHAAQFLAIRGLRQRALGQRFTEFEKGVESNEGLAEYAGRKAGMMAVKAGTQPASGRSAARDDAVVYLHTRFQDLSMLDRKKGVRDWLYSTGSAIAFLLDRLDRDWKRAVQKTGAAPQDLLENAIGPAGAIDVLARRELRRYDYASRLSEEEQTLAREKARRARALDVLLSEKGRRYLIDFSALGKPVNVTGFDPMNIMAIDPVRRIHTRMLMLAEPRSYDIAFNQPVLEDSGKRLFLTVSSTGSDQIVADGARLDLDRPVERPFTRLQINTPGFRLEAGEGVLEVLDGGVVVRLGTKRADGSGRAIFQQSFLTDLSRRTAAVPGSILSIRLLDAQGNPHRLADVKGKRVYLLFVSAQSWAVPSHKYFDSLTKLYADGLAPKEDVNVLVISSQNTREQVAAFLKSHTSALTVLVDELGEAASYFNPVPYRAASLPFVVGLDAAGRIDFQQSGFTPEKVEELKKRIFRERQ